MSSSIFPDDFYINLKEACETLDASPGQKLIVSSIGKQSLGKSYFLNKIFDKRFPTKDCQNISKGTKCFERIEFNDFHLFDMEGLQSSESSIMRDSFNFFSMMSISNVVLLHISQNDLENRVFIKHFAFLVHQCFSPFRSTCYTFRMHMPKVILLIKDPRWDNEDNQLLENYENLVRTFQQSLDEEIKNCSNELINYFRDAELKNAENDKKVIEKITMEYDKIANRENEFKIDEFYPVYFQQSGFGEYKKINYFKVRSKDGKVSIKKSKFNFLKKSILRSEPIISPQNYKENSSVNSSNNPCNQFTGIEEFYKILNIMDEQRIKETSLVSIISTIYIDIKNDIFFNTDNIDELYRFISKYYTIKNDLENILKSASKSIELKEMINYFRRLLKFDEHNFINEIKLKTEVTFLNILEKNRLLDLKPKILNYFRLILVKQFNSVFSLDPSNHNSLLFSTLFAILNFKRQDLTSNQISKILAQKKLFECLWLYDETFEEILKCTFTKSFKYFDSFIYLIGEKINLIDLGLDEFKLKLEKYQIKVLNLSDLKENVESFLNPFIKLTSINQEIFTDFLDSFDRISELKIVEILDKKSLFILKPFQDIDILIIEDVIESKDLIYTLFPSLTGLMIGIMTTIIRSVLIAQAAGAVAAVAATAWIPIFGWAIFGVTTLLTFGWFYYEINKQKQPRKLKEYYKSKNGWKICKCVIKHSSVNGTIEVKKSLSKTPADELKFECIFTKDEKTFYSAFAKVIIILLLEQDLPVAKLA